MVIKKCSDLDVYKLSFETCMKIFEITKTFPKEERYSLIDQIRRSSRSIPANIREGFAKRKYPDVFVLHLNDAYGSCEETLAWLGISNKCNYIDNTTFYQFNNEYNQLGAMLFKLMKNWQKF